MNGAPPVNGTFAAMLAGIAAFLLIPSASSAEPSAPLQLEAKISLGNVAGRIDHMAYDTPRNRLFVAELGNNSVGVVDINARKVIHRISGLKEPQGVAYLASRDLLYVTNGGDGEVRIHRGSDFSPAAVIPLGSDADNIRLDPSGNRIVIGYGRGALALIDPAGGAKVVDIPLKAHPESFQLDPDLEYVPGQTVHEYLGKRKGTSAADGKRMNDAMAAMAKEVGLEYNFDKAKAIDPDMMKRMTY